MPAGPSFPLALPTRLFTLRLHPASRGERLKTGATDESVMLDAADAPWLGPLLQQLLAGVPHRHLFGLSYPQAKSFWDSAVQRAGLAAIKPVMYMCRHGGPSHDRRMRLRTQEEVKRRLRLVSDSALRRYEAHALIQLEEKKLGEALLAEARTAWRLLPEKLRAALGRPSLGSSRRGASSSPFSRARGSSLRRSPGGASTPGPSTLPTAPLEISHAQKFKGVLRRM